jgi:hypothetical protein
MKAKGRKCRELGDDSGLASAVEGSLAHLRTETNWISGDRRVGDCRCQGKNVNRPRFWRSLEYILFLTLKEVGTCFL